jgi:hypothetical protein
MPRSSRGGLCSDPAARDVPGGCGRLPNGQTISTLFCGAVSRPICKLKYRVKVGGRGLRSRLATVRPRLRGWVRGRGSLWSPALVGSRSASSNSAALGPGGTTWVPHHPILTDTITCADAYLDAFLLRVRSGATWGAIGRRRAISASP